MACTHQGVVVKLLKADHVELAVLVDGLQGHELSDIGVTAAAGANLAWAEVGTNPRDLVERTENGGRGASLEEMRKMFLASGWEVLEGPSQGWM